MYPSLGCSIADIEKQGAVLVVGSNLRAEAPIIAHRVRKAAVSGAQVSFVNSAEHEYYFDVANSLSGGGLAEMLAGVLVAAAAGKDIPEHLVDICAGVTASDTQKRIAASLRDSDEALVLFGNIAATSSAFTAVRALAAGIADLTGAKLGAISDGPNAAGAHLAGVLPHRAQGGENREVPGLGTAATLATPMDAIVLVNIEPDEDIRVSADPVGELARQKFVVALTPFVSDALLDSADLLLPTGTFAETSGTYVNIEGTWQSFSGVASPVGEARPTWKILRVLGNLLEAPGFDYVTSEDVRDEFVAQLGDVQTSNQYDGTSRIAAPNGSDAATRHIDVPLYRVDALVRRATALQLTDAAKRSSNTGDAK